MCVCIYERVVLELGCKCVFVCVCVCVCVCMRERERREIKMSRKRRCKFCCNFPPCPFLLDNLIVLSQSYKNLISSFFRFLLLSLSVCSIRQYCLCCKMAMLNSEKRKKSSFLRRKKFGRIDSWFFDIINDGVVQCVSHI